MDVVAKDDGEQVVNVGKMVEDMEGKMRNLLQEVYFGKTRDVVGDLRSKCLVSSLRLFLARVVDEGGWRDAFNASAQDTAISWTIG